MGDTAGNFGHLCPQNDETNVLRKYGKKKHKLAKKLNKKKLKVLKKTGEALMHEAQAYVDMAQHSCNASNTSNGSRWNANANIVQTFCQACQDNCDRCIREAPLAPPIAAAALPSGLADNGPLSAGIVMITGIAVGTCGTLIAGRLWSVLRRQASPKVHEMPYCALG